MLQIIRELTDQEVQQLIRLRKQMVDAGGVMAAALYCNENGELITPKYLAWSTVRHREVALDEETAMALVSN